jgi:FkbM family methyltransferase
MTSEETAAGSAAGAETRWIVDVGAHQGHDSGYYLDKGFNVVAVEAFPGHCEALRSTFAKEIAEGRFHLEPVGIAGETKAGKFYVHAEKDDWHTANRERWRGRYDEIEIPYVTYDTIAARYPRPYYVKVDIVGSERHVLDALSPSTRPDYLSFELNGDWEHNVRRAIELGYAEMAIVNQRTNIGRRAPSPSREGKPVTALFTAYQSGPFGRDVTGWQPVASNEEAAQLVASLAYDENSWFDAHFRTAEAAAAAAGDA